MVVSFLMDRKQRLISKSVTYKSHSVNKGTAQGSVSGPHLFNLFFHDDNNLTSIVKYADDTTLHVKVCTNEIDPSREVVNHFFSWTQNNAMACNLKKMYQIDTL